MKYSEIIKKLTERFGEGIIPGEASDMPTITVDHKNIHEVIAYLKEEPFGYDFLTDLCGIHYPQNALPLGVIYHLHNLYERKRIRIKTFLPIDEPEIPTVTDLHAGANWMERETFDFYGIRFRGHPNMKRILNVEYMDYHPMRKEYPLEDQTRKDKDDRFFGR